MSTVLLVLVLTLSFSPALAQSPSPSSIALLEQELVRLRNELATCQGVLASKTTTATAGLARADAIASLRAVRSALQGGATLQDFRRYHLESKVKVDALQDSPDSALIKHVSAIYTDALSFSVARAAGVLLKAVIDDAQSKYSAHAGNILAGMYPEESGPTRFQRELNKTSAGAMADTLFALAAKKLDELR